VARAVFAAVDAFAGGPEPQVQDAELVLAITCLRLDRCQGCAGFVYELGAQREAPAWVAILGNQRNPSNAAVGAAEHFFRVEHSATVVTFDDDMQRARFRGETRLDVKLNQHLRGGVIGAPDTEAHESDPSK
jgi:hypothetical protein